MERTPERALKTTMPESSSFLRLMAGVASPVGAFAVAEDYEACRRLHRRYGTTYYFSTQRLPVELRNPVHALYGFVRVPDEWVDNPDGLTVLERSVKLEAWRNDLLRGLDGVRPESPVLRAFCDVMRERSIPTEEPLLFLDAMERDLTQARYETFGELRDYMRGSASAVGLMMCHILGVGDREEVSDAAIALGEAMQLTNFLRDVGEDGRRGRIYLPLEDLESFGVSEQDVLEGRRTPAFRELMRFEIARARALYAASDPGIPMLPPSAQKGVRLARILYARILDRIEARDFDVFTGRARTSKVEKLTVAARVMLGR